MNWWIAFNSVLYFLASLAWALSGHKMGWGRVGRIVLAVFMLTYCVGTVVHIWEPADEIWWWRRILFAEFAVASILGVIATATCGLLMKRAKWMVIIALIPVASLHYIMFTVLASSADYLHLWVSFVIGFPLIGAIIAFVKASDRFGYCLFGYCLFHFLCVVCYFM